MNELVLIQNSITMSQQAIFAAAVLYAIINKLLLKLIISN